jgi:hypothetical protein
MPSRKGGKPAKPSKPRARRAPAVKTALDREVCPRCGRPSARLIGRSDMFPVLYLRCDDCHHTSVMPA